MFARREFYLTPRLLCGSSLCTHLPLRQPLFPPSPSSLFANSFSQTFSTLLSALFAYSFRIIAYTFTNLFQKALQTVIPHATYLLAPHFWIFRAPSSPHTLFSGSQKFLIKCFSFVFKGVLVWLAFFVYWGLGFGFCLGRGDVVRVGFCGSNFRLIRFMRNHFCLVEVVRKWFLFSVVSVCYWFRLVCVVSDAFSRCPKVWFFALRSRFLRY